MTWINRENK